MRRGISTTEFWLALAANVAATVLLAIGRITPETWMGVIAGTSGAYAIGRSIVKKGETEVRIGDDDHGPLAGLEQRDLDAAGALIADEGSP